MSGPRDDGGNRCSVLVVDDEATIRVSLRDSLSELEDIGEVHMASSGDEALAIVRERPIEVVVSDVRMPGLSGLDLLAQVRDLGLSTEVVLITAYGSVEHAVAAIKMGAYDYVTKPFPNERVVRLVRNICQVTSLQRELTELRACCGEDPALGRLVGRSRPWLRLVDKLRTVATTESTVLIVGESGTGKELLADAVHRLSARQGRPFVKVHCAALPDSLLESELFGHERGAFTGAVRRVLGRFEVADGGTLLLDEVDEIPAHIQVKLLRVLQERVIERVGSPKPRPIDVRLVALSKCDLLEAVEAGRFRKDLYYRLSVIQLEVPTLLERRDDIPLLLDHFLAVYRRRMRKPALGFSSEALRRLGAYDYPGNVRELAHVVESACAVAGGRETVDVEHLPERVRQAADPAAHLAVGFHGRTLPEATRAFERSYLEHALSELGPSRTELARRLGISRKSLWEKLKRHGLDGPDATAQPIGNKP